VLWSLLKKKAECDASARDVVPQKVTLGGHPTQRSSALVEHRFAMGGRTRGAATALHRYLVRTTEYGVPSSDRRRRVGAWQERHQSYKAKRLTLAQDGCDSNGQKDPRAHTARRLHTGSSARASARPTVGADRSTSPDLNANQAIGADEPQQPTHRSHVCHKPHIDPPPRAVSTHPLSVVAH
jgi:hypothetical protein